MIKNGDVICFLGDSITAEGLWEAEVYQHVGRYKDIKVYNCGVHGSRAALAADYIYGLCLMKNPDKVVVALGVNDISRWVLSKNYGKDDGPEIVKQGIRTYAEKMDYITKSIIEHDAEPILCTPVPYDEHTEHKEENLRCDYALAECADIVRGLAEKYGCKLVDLRSNMLEYIREREILSPDRVHPTALGYHLMAQIFMREMGEIERCDIDTPFRAEEWNAKRRNVERQLKSLDFIDYCHLFEKSHELGWGVPERLAECRARYEAAEDKQIYTSVAYKFYIENYTRREELTNELARLTVYPRKARKK